MLHFRAHLLLVTFSGWFLESRSPPQTLHWTFDIIITLGLLTSNFLEVSSFHLSSSANWVFFCSVMKSTKLTSHGHRSSRMISIVWDLSLLSANSLLMTFDFFPVDAATRFSLHRRQFIDCLLSLVSGTFAILSTRSFTKLSHGMLYTTSFVPGEILSLGCTSRDLS